VKRLSNFRVRVRDEEPWGEATVGELRAGSFRSGGGEG